MTDAEFRRRAHAILSRLWKPPVGEFTTIDVGGEGEDEIKALIAAGPVFPFPPVRADGNGKLLGLTLCCPCCGGSGDPCPKDSPMCCVQRIQRTSIERLGVVLGCCDVVGHSPECPVNRRKTPWPWT